MPEGALTFTARGAPITPSDLDAVELATGVVLPADYRAFMLAHNGGVPSRASFAVDGYGRGRVRRFCSARDPDDLAIAWRLFKHPDDPRLPPEFIPIARCDGGALVCLAVSGEAAGAPFIWDHAGEADEGYTYANLHPAGSTLGEFLAALTS